MKSFTEYLIEKKKVDDEMITALSKNFQHHFDKYTALAKDLQAKGDHKGAKAALETAERAYNNLQAIKAPQ